MWICNIILYIWDVELRLLKRIFKNTLSDKTSTFDDRVFVYMEIKTISKETLERVKSLPRLDYMAFKLLVMDKKIECFIKFRSPRTIFFDESDNFFYYLNPYHKHLQRCGKWIDENYQS